MPSKQDAAGSSPAGPTIFDGIGGIKIYGFHKGVLGLFKSKKKNMVIAFADLHGLDGRFVGFWWQFCFGSIHLYAFLMRDCWMDFLQRDERLSKMERRC